MENTIKISMTIEINGGTLVRKSTPILIKSHSHISHNNKKKNKKEGLEEVKKIEYSYYPLIPQPASRHINIPKSAYNFMISSEYPVFIKSKQWNRMSKKQRLEAHLQEICDHFNGISYTYEILED